MQGNPETLGQLLRRTEKRLAIGGIGDAGLEAGLIWMTALTLDRTHLYASLKTEPTLEQTATAEELISRRLRHEPAAYLMGKREFYGLELHVAPGVLIPRQDTETLVEEALRLANARAGDPLLIADMGCGTGAVGIALAAHLAKAKVYAVDTSKRALEVAGLNIDRHGLTGRVIPLHGSLLAPLPEPVDLIAANLPYVASAEIPLLEPEVRMYEPREALDGGDDGLDLIRQLLTGAPASLLPGGAVLLEMDPRQIASATQFASQAVPNAHLSVVQDLARRDRVLIVQT